MKIDKKKNYLVIYEGNWADEMDISGFCTIDGESLADAKKEICAYKNEIEICIGTNEEVYYENGKDFWENLNIKEITTEQSKVLSDLFNGDDSDDFEDDDFIMEVFYKEMEDNETDFSYEQLVEKIKKLTPEERVKLIEEGKQIYANQNGDVEFGFGDMLSRVLEHISECDDEDEDEDDE